MKLINKTLAKQQQDCDLKAALQNKPISNEMILKYNPLAI